MKKLTFEGHPENNRHKVAVFPQNAVYKLKGTDPCKLKEAGPIMPVQWQWLRTGAKFAGNLELGANSFVMFQGEEKGKSLSVAINTEGLPVFYRKEGKRYTVEMHFTRYAQQQPDSSLFVLPEACVEVQVSRDAQAAPQLDLDNATIAVGAPLNLNAVISKAREICTCGCPYVWGGNGPCCSGGKSGYDCSGMTTRAYSAGGYSIPRTAAGQQNSGKSCAGGEQAGDLLFFGNPAYHVVMSLGGGKIAECPDVGMNCRVTSWRSHNGGCRRIA
jgi:hypothetical protein